MNAVLREITKLFAMRDRSVVTSSVIPSAKYCCSGSLLRLTSGNTTIDSRTAASGCAIDVVAATAGFGEDLVAGQSHQAPPATTSTAAMAAPINARARRLRSGAALGLLGAGDPAIESGRRAWTRT